jgi:hypothetical protein
MRRGGIPMRLTSDALRAEVKTSRAHTHNPGCRREMVKSAQEEPALPSHIARERGRAQTMIAG